MRMEISKVMVGGALVAALTLAGCKEEGQVQYVEGFSEIVSYAHTSSSYPNYRGVDYQGILLTWEK